MRVYELGKDYGLDSDNGEFTISPHWVLYVIRFEEPLTASKERLLRVGTSDLYQRNISIDDSADTITKTRRPLIISKECLALEVTASKRSHVHSLQAVLAGGRDYMSAIYPGDWIFAWMMNDVETYIDVVNRLSTKPKNLNGFRDGLKFVGRVHTIDESLNQTPDGLRLTQTSIQGVGFGELDSATFFDPNLARNEQYIERVLQNLNIPLKDIISQSSRDAAEGRGIDVNVVIPGLIRAFIGDGLSGPGVDAGGIQTVTGASVQTKEAPYAYVIPSEVAALLGVERPSKKDSQVYSYADILSTVLGLQKYTDPVEGEDYRLLLPDGVYRWGGDKADDIFGKGIRHTTSHRLSGEFMPVPFSFGGRSVWSILEDYSNPAINEMYTALKVGPDGRVMPTLTLRQMPYTSPPIAAAYQDKVTAFHELPRWRAHPSTVISLNVGRSDAARTNFVHIYGTPVKPTKSTDIVEQLARNPPINDLQDYKRNGLRPHMAKYPSSPVEIVSGHGPSFWMMLRSDVLMGQHLTLTGSVTLVGVTPPISPGDNFEFMDTVYHIESVSHSCRIDKAGRRTFVTRLALSHGVRAKEVTPEEIVKVRSDARLNEERLFARIDAVDTGNTTSITQGDVDIVWREGVIDTASTMGRLLSLAEENIDGIELNVLKGGGNPDRYLYTGVLADDDTEFHPGITIDEEDD